MDVKCKLLTPSNRGWIVDVGWNSGQDGPGQRAVIYFKGCNFACPWCAAPETMAFYPEPLIRPERCTEPERLGERCPLGAIDMKRDDAGSFYPAVNSALCRDCREHSCASASWDGAIQLAGREVEAEELVKHLSRYRAFFGSDGGVTLTGGEPTCRPDFALVLLHGFKAEGIGTAVESNGSSPRFAEFIPLIDHFIIDLKHPDDEQHHRLTRHSNTRTIANIRAAAATGRPVWVRMPLLPGINDDAATLHRLADVLQGMPDNVAVELLPYHQRGICKWRLLGRDYALNDIQVPSEKEHLAAELLLRSRGLQVRGE
ncbi:MAG: glycyl-radical enzyme activating protein [bacterium]|nr:glycyl-radical enzyme activating protein [bacterium]